MLWIENDDPLEILTTLQKYCFMFSFIIFQIFINHTINSVITMFNILYFVIFIKNK